jgi:hypothetical protein
MKKWQAYSAGFFKPSNPFLMSRWKGAPLRLEKAGTRLAVTQLLCIVQSPATSAHMIVHNAKQVLQTIEDYKR